MEKIIILTLIIMLSTMVFADVNIEENINSDGGNINQDINVNTNGGDYNLNVDGTNLWNSVNSKIQDVSGGVSLEKLMRVMKNSYRYYTGNYVLANYEEKYWAGFMDSFMEYKLTPYRNKINELEKKNIELELRIEALEKATFSIGYEPNTNDIQKQVNEQLQINRRISLGDPTCYSSLNRCVSIKEIK
jgi:predicted RNase H-like nuclease (RuvC/YqgF family)